MGQALRIHSAALSAIMRVGEFVLPETMLGIIEASTTRKLGTPCNLNRLSTTESESFPILQVPHGWNMVVPISPARCTSSYSAVYCPPGQCYTG